MRSRKRSARLAGALYLAYIAVTIFANVTRDRLVVPGDAAATTERIVASVQLLRFSFVGDVLAGVLFLLTAWALYVLLKPVNTEVALLFLLLNAAGVAVQCLNMLNLFAAAVIVTDGGSLSAFTGEQSQALALLFVELHEAGFGIAQFFFAAWLLPLGYLVLTSGYLPRLLGVILMVESAAWLLYPLQYFLAPALSGVRYVSSMVGFIGEFSLALWLLIMGAREEEPTPAVAHA
jgi:hypothetical protein